MRFKSLGDAFNSFLFVSFLTKKYFPVKIDISCLLYFWLHINIIHGQFHIGTDVV